MTKKSGISSLSFGLAIGIVWGLAIFILGLTATYFNYGTSFVEWWKPFYLGYAATLQGSFIGLAFGILDGFIFGAAVAFIYNRLLKKIK